MSYNQTKNKYEFKYTPKVLGLFEDSYMGATSLKPIDIDKDGDVDLVIVTEGIDSYGMQVWANDGNGNYIPNQTIKWKFSEFSFREFEIVDVDSDGDIDIVFTPFQNSKSFRPNTNGNDPGFGINLQNAIWINDNGTFKPYSKSILIPKVQPGFMKGVMFDGKLHFIGFEDLHTNDPMENRFKLHDVTVTF